MAKKLFGLLVVGFLLCTSVLSQTKADELTSNLRWYFGIAGGSNTLPTDRIPDAAMLVGEGPIPGYHTEFMLYFGPIGIGTILEKWNMLGKGVGGTGEFQIGDTTYTWSVGQGFDESYLPLVVRLISYSKAWAYGSLCLYEYLEGSCWVPNMGYVQYDFFSSYEGRPFCSYRAYRGPSYYVDLGLGLSLNPLRALPVNLKLGMLRAKYSALSLPEPFKGRIPYGYATTTTSYYFLLESSLGYDFPVGRALMKAKWRFDIVGASNDIRIKNDTVLEPSDGERSYTIKLMLYFGSIGIGTALQEEIKLSEYSNVWFLRHMSTSLVSERTFKCYFPIMIHCVPFSRPLGYGNFSLYSYLKGSAWAMKESCDWWNINFTPTPTLYHPSYYFDLGICISFNPLRFIPLELRAGMLKINYVYDGKLDGSVPLNSVSHP
ncbi:MAG TPA: hypothetical protein EYP60_03990, partial [bacterium (Candidatus Stahlbacteria)]|nr:hypothetical protein [Candidatus Stahlbacteria bacterium]